MITAGTGKGGPTRFELEAGGQCVAQCARQHDDGRVPRTGHVWLIVDTGNAVRIIAAQQAGVM